LANANLFVDAFVNDWTSAHVNVFYKDSNANGIPVPKNYPLAQVAGLEEGYVTLHNFSQMPLYVRAGTQFVDFGSYNVHPMFPGLSQLMSETNATALTVGTAFPEGMYASAYTFKGAAHYNLNGTNTTAHTLNTIGAQLGVANEMNGISYDLGAGYINDISNTHHFVDILKAYDGTAQMISTHKVPGWNAHLCVGNGPYYGKFNMTGTTTAFSVSDLRSNGHGAKPSAYDVNLGYQFKTNGHDSSFELGYGHSTQGNALVVTNSARLGLPANRYQAIYNVNLMPNTDLGLGIVNDHDSAVSDGGTGIVTTTGTVRLSVQFA